MAQVVDAEALLGLEAQGFPIRALLQQQQGQAPQVPRGPRNCESLLIGFDTGRQEWFVHVYDEQGQQVTIMYARKVVVKNGRAAQFDWKDPQGRNIWHVRERILAKDFESLSMGKDNTLVITCGTVADPDYEGEKALIARNDWDHLKYAFHLQSKGDDEAPKAFLELCYADDQVMGRISNKWIVLEGVTHRETTGQYPHIRLKISREDIKDIVLTRTCAVIVGNS